MLYISPQLRSAVCELWQQHKHNMTYVFTCDYIHACDARAQEWTDLFCPGEYQRHPWLPAIVGEFSRHDIRLAMCYAVLTNDRKGILALRKVIAEARAREL